MISLSMRRYPLPFVGLVPSSLFFFRSEKNDPKRGGSMLSLMLLEICEISRGIYSSKAQNLVATLCNPILGQ